MAQIPPADDPQPHGSHASVSDSPPPGPAGPPAPPAPPGESEPQAGAVEPTADAEAAEATPADPMSEAPADAPADAAQQAPCPVPDPAPADDESSPSLSASTESVPTEPDSTESEPPDSETIESESAEAGQDDEALPSKIDADPGPEVPPQEAQPQPDPSIAKVNEPDAVADAAFAPSVASAAPEPRAAEFADAEPPAGDASEREQFAAAPASPADPSNPGGGAASDPEPHAQPQAEPAPASDAHPLSAPGIGGVSVAAAPSTSPADRPMPHWAPVRRNRDDDDAPAQSPFEASPPSAHAPAASNAAAPSNAGALETDRPARTDGAPATATEARRRLPDALEDDHALAVRILTIRELFQRYAYDPVRPRCLMLDVPEIGVFTAAHVLFKARRSDGVRETAPNSVPALPPNCYLHHGAAHRFQDWVEPDSIDLIFGLDVLQDVADLDQMFAQAVRALRPGGLLIVIERGSAVESLVSGIGLHVDSEQIARVTREELQGPIRRAGMKWVHAERLGFGPGEWLARIGLASTPERLLQVDQAVRSVRLLNFGFRDQAFVIRKPGPGG